MTALADTKSNKAESNSRDGTWRRVPLGDLVAKMSNGIVAKQTKDGVGVPVSRIETISQGVVDLSRVGFVSSVRPDDIKRYQILPGDILLSHINSDMHLGKTAI